MDRTDASRRAPHQAAPHQAAPHHAAPHHQPPHHAAPHHQPAHHAAPHHQPAHHAAPHHQPAHLAQQHQRPRRYLRPHARRLATALRADHPGAAYLRQGDGTTRATALTVLTPVPRFWLLVQRLILRLRALLGPDQKLRGMAFIHFAHWVTIRRFPGASRPTRYGYLLFQSNFNGAWSKYIDAFSIAIPARMALVWATSFGFPGALPPRRFRRYIARNDRPVDHYYSAYPQASVTEIAAALRLVESFTRDVLPAADTDPATFAAAWRRFVDTAQHDL